MHGRTHVPFQIMYLHGVERFHVRMFIKHVPLMCLENDLHEMKTESYELYLDSTDNLKLFLKNFLNFIQFFGNF